MRSKIIDRMESGKEEETRQHVFLDRATRATRGKRMTKLLDDEVEEDELFWNQDALKDEEIDVEYEEEAEAADVFDSDFDEDEPEADQQEENEPDDRMRTRKKLIYPGKPSAKKKKNKVFPKLGVTPKNEKTSEQSTPSEQHEAPDDVEAEKIVRKSTRTSVIVRQAERDAIREALQATMKPVIKKKKEGEARRMTQEDMLLEAAQTEIINLRNLEKVLAREEEVKKRAIVHKAVYCGPQIRYLSRNGKLSLCTFRNILNVGLPIEHPLGKSGIIGYTYLEFMNGSSFESELSTTSAKYPGKAVCPVTGLPAIYRDPKTGLPYATKEAFKIIRERFEKESSSRKTDTSVALLSDAAYEQGFSQRRKRSVISQNPETSYPRNFARFKKFPTLEDQDSD